MIPQKQDIRILQQINKPLVTLGGFIASVTTHAYVQGSRNGLLRNQSTSSCLQCTTATSTCRDICTTPVPQALTSHRWFSSSHFVPVECTKSSTLYLEWEGFASYLEGWTGTFKTDPDLKEVVVWTSHFVYFQPCSQVLLGEEKREPGTRCLHMH